MQALELVRAALAGRYAVERELGSGGMATVYLARDEKHNRKVAVKVLRPEIAATLGAERFSREIQVAAQLQHPHILPLLDSGEAAGLFYYVMPFVDGESLRERLARGGELPVHDAVRILSEIADALAHAHALGVVHRDIKPDNIMVSGRHALVTDFGVAKAVSEATGRHNLTTAGVALGTPAYMAPEQAAADPNLDHRVDIYAIGALAYELLTGRPPFHGLSPQEMLAAHITRQPVPVDQARGGMSPVLAQIVMRCLAKRPADRWQSAEELLGQLEPLYTTSTGITPAGTRPMAAALLLPARKAWAVGIGAGVVAMLAIAAVVATRGGEQSLQLGRRTQVTLDPALELDPALSPDGRLLAYSGPRGIAVRQVDGGAPVRVTPDGEPAAFPAWTPDGRRLLFLSNRGIEIVPALGGVPRVVVPGPGLSPGIAVAPDGLSLAYAQHDSLYVRLIEGGVPRLVTAGRELHSFAWSPDGRRIAYVAGNWQFVEQSLGNIAPSTIWVVPAAGGQPLPVTDDRWLNVSPAWTPEGRLLFVSDRDGGRDVYQVRLRRSGAPAGEPVRLTTGLSAHGISMAATGARFAYSSFTERSNVWSIAIPASGVASIAQARPVTAGNQTIESFDLSPDGRWIVFDSDRGGTQQLFRMRLEGGEPEQLTTDSASVFFPDYSPDGREIVFHGFRGGHREIFVMPADGGPPVQATRGADDERAATWSPDGTRLLMLANFGTRPRLHVMHRAADGSWGAPREITVMLRGDTVPAGIGMWSPDGRWIAGSVGGLVLIAPADGGEARLLAQASRGTAYLDWSSDSRLLYYLHVDSAGMVLREVPVAGGRGRDVVRFDDPTRPWHRFGLRIRSGRAYFTLGELQSDIYVAEIGAAR